MTITIDNLTKNIGENTVISVSQKDTAQVLDIHVSGMYDEYSGEITPHDGVISIPIEQLEQFTKFCSNVNKMIEQEKEEE